MKYYAVIDTNVLVIEYAVSEIEQYIALLYFCKYFLEDTVLQTGRAVFFCGRRRIDNGKNNIDATLNVSKLFNNSNNYRQLSNGRIASSFFNKMQEKGVCY